MILIEVFERRAMPRAWSYATEPQSYDLMTTRKKTGIQISRTCGLNLLPYSRALSVLNKLNTESQRQTRGWEFIRTSRDFFWLARKSKN